MRFALLSFFAVSFSIHAFAAGPCNASGAEPLDCKSGDGKYEILINANRNITGLGISTTGFCDKGYMKLDGKEINGALGDDSVTLGLSYVEAVTSDLGVRVNNKAMKRVMLPNTVVGFELNDAGKSMVSGIDSGSVFVFDDSAWLYLYDGDQQKEFSHLTCK